MCFSHSLFAASLGVSLWRKQTQEKSEYKCSSDGWQNISFMYNIIEMDVPGTEAIADLYYISENICFLNYVLERPFSLNLSDNGSHCTMSPPLTTFMHHSALHSETDKNGCHWRGNDMLSLKTGTLLTSSENPSKVGVPAEKLFQTLRFIMARFHM